LLGLLLLLTVSFTPLKVGTIRFEQLVAMSDVIAVAKVTAIESAGDKRFALLETSQLIKGAIKADGEGEVSRASFLAQATWMCDISTAKVGEEALLFLVRSKEDTKDFDVGATRAALGVQDLFRIAHAGRGRMPIHAGSTDRHVAAWGDIRELSQWADTCPDCRHEKPLAELVTETRAIVTEQAALPAR
jgi:hypothetical protein